MVSRGPTLRHSRAVLPNAGIEAEYRRRLLALLDDMDRSLVHWLRAAYRRHEPATAASDASPVDAIRRAMRELARRWLRNFDEAAPRLAEHFSKAAADRSDAALRRVLRDAGISVRFAPTAAARDVVGATVAQNVALIRSIPQQYLTQVEGIVMRSVQTGRDLGQLTKDLRDRLGVERRRAELIALDQNNKATSAMLHARLREVGIEEAVWMHSHAGREPRPTHVAMNGRRYRVAEGMYDPAERRNVWPGELINCRCSAKPVVAGFS